MSEVYNRKPVDFIEIENDGYLFTIKNTAEKENGIALLYESFYMGDHSEGWVLQVNLEGEEIARYNTKFIKKIKWLL